MQGVLAVRRGVQPEFAHGQGLLGIFQIVGQLGCLADDGRVTGAFRCPAVVAKGHAQGLALGCHFCHEQVGQGLAVIIRGAGHRHRGFRGGLRSWGLAGAAVDQECAAERQNRVTDH